MAKSDRKGRGEGRFIQLAHQLTGSVAWRDLSGSAIKVYVALARFNNGGNNGELFMSIDVGVRETGLARNTVAKALRDLEEHGFIAAVERGYFQVKGGTATTWRLTHLPCPNARPKAPTLDYLGWQGGNKTRSQKLTPAVSKTATGLETFPAAVPEFATVPVETPLVSVGEQCSNSGIQVLCHRQGRPERGNTTWKQANSANGPSDGGEIDLAELRGALASYLAGAGVGAQTRLSVAAQIPSGTLSKFKDGRGLARAHCISLGLALAEQRRSNVA